MYFHHVDVGVEVSIGGGTTFPPVVSLVDGKTSSYEPTLPLIFDGGYLQQQRSERTQEDASERQFSRGIYRQQDDVVDLS